MASDCDYTIGQRTRPDPVSRPCVRRRRNGPPAQQLRRALIHPTCVFRTPQRQHQYLEKKVATASSEEFARCERNPLSSWEREGEGQVRHTPSKSRPFVSAKGVKMRQKLRDRKGGGQRLVRQCRIDLAFRDENEVRKSVTGFQSRRSLGESKVDVEV